MGPGDRKTYETATQAVSGGVLGCLLGCVPGLVDGITCPALPCSAVGCFGELIRLILSVSRVEIVNGFVYKCWAKAGGNRSFVDGCSFPKLQQYTCLFLHVE